MNSTIGWKVTSSPAYVSVCKQTPTESELELSYVKPRFRVNWAHTLEFW